MIDINPKSTDTKRFHSGPSRSETLSPELVDQISLIYAVVGHYVTTSLEKFKVEFMQNAKPEVEVGLWTCVAVAWINYHEQHLVNIVLSDEVERRLVHALLAIASGVEVEGVEVLGVPAEVGRRLLACYDGLGS